MEVKCDSCKAIINIRDESLPRGKRLRIKCPKCDSKISVMPSTGEQGKVPSSAKVKAGSSDVNPEEGLPGDKGLDALGLFEEGTKLALIMAENKDMADDLSKQLRGLGYKVLIARDTRGAIGNIRLHQFDIILLSDQFDGNDLNSSPVLEYLKQLPMSIRRQIFLALIGEEFKTMDLMMAFVMSADLVIGKGDTARVAEILRVAIPDKERFYRLFKETLDEAGKA